MVANNYASTSQKNKKYLLKQKNIYCRFIQKENKVMSLDQGPRDVEIRFLEINDS